jgi:outer membrane protein OmpA-like peptidoglycan-associated protein
MKFRSALLAGAALFALGTPAMAQNAGWYLGLAGGYDELELVHGFANLGPLKGNGVAGYDGGAIVLGTAGYKWDWGLRTELELGWDQHDATAAVAFNPPVVFVKPAIGGGAETMSALVNFIYDYDLGNGWGVSLGGGVGVGSVNEYLHVGGFKAVQGANANLEWQGIAGVNYAIDDNVELFADYRYRSVELDDNYAAPVGGPGARVRVFANHEQVGLLGIRWYMNEEEAAPPPPLPPAPPPPPPPMPAPVKTFIVFFDFDKSDLTDKAQEVVAEAVRTAKANGFVKVLVTGHTDTVGSDAYNQALSIRRAETVKDEMVRDGLDGGGIEIVGKSFHDPLVPTGPDVREPQNRRAVIDLGG